MSTDIDMTPAQIRALKIYTHSANLHNDYKPKSFEPAFPKHLTINQLK